MNEILELNTLLRGEDSERVGLEKKKISLTTAVQHQEARFLHEFEEINKLENELLQFEIHADKIFSEILPGLNISSRANESDQLTKQLASLLQERYEIQELLNDAKQEVALLTELLDLQPSEEEIQRVKTMVKQSDSSYTLRVKESKYLNKQLNSNQEQCNVLVQEYSNMEDHFNHLQAALKTLDEDFEQVTIRKADLTSKLQLAAQTLSFTRQNVHNAREKLADNMRDTAVDEKNNHTTLQQRLFNLEISKQQLQSKQFTQYAHLSGVKHLNADIERLQRQCHALKANIANQRTSSSFAASEIRILQEELQLLQNQQYSFASNIYLESLEQLNQEVVELKTKVDQLIQCAEETEYQVKNPKESAQLQLQLQDLQQGLVRKEQLMSNIHLLTLQVQEHTNTINQSEVECHCQEGSLVKEMLEARHKLQDSQVLVSTYNHTAAVEKELAQTVIEKQQVFQSTFCKLEEHTNTLIDLEDSCKAAGKQVDDKKRQAEEWMQKTEAQKIEEVFERVNQYRQARQADLQQALLTLEAALLDEDREFQETVSTLEKNLIARKNELQRLVRTAREAATMRNTSNQKRSNNNNTNTNNNSGNNNNSSSNHMNNSKNPSASLVDTNSRRLAPVELPVQSVGRKRSLLNMSSVSRGAGQTTNTNVVRPMLYQKHHHRIGTTKENIAEEDQEIQQYQYEQGEQDSSTALHHQQTRKKQARMRGLDI